MQRLFTGFRLPEPIVDWLSGLELEMAGARWIDPDDYHVSIRFFGEVNRHVAEDIRAGLSSLYLPRFSARVTGLACFGGDRPRALVAEVEAEPSLADLRRAHERIALSAGLEPERRKYVPHVTLARLNGTRPDTVARYIQSVSRPALPAFTVSEVELLSSKPGGGGGPYLTEEAFSLAGSRFGVPALSPASD